MKNRETELEGVAIIGMAGRFPGAADVRAFWRNLVDGVESISRLTDAQLLAAGVAPDLLDNPDYVKARGLLEGVEHFDAAFFGYAPAEAARIDPQHRLFLECAWEALEDAGCDPERIEGPVGVYAGQSLPTYLLHHLCPTRSAVEELTHAYQVGHYPTLIGNDKDYLASRCSYKLNLRGPSIAVQTACSTSLVAVCQAVQSLLTYQCDLALAGGVSIAFPQHRGYLYQEGSIASPDGHCRAFDARARGTVFGAGCGIVVLKRLEDALHDGDRIDAVIRGAALNNDGSAKASFSAPSPDGQAEVIALAHALAGVDADTIGYVEAHGTGTPLGDPIEVEGLTQAFRLGTSRRQFCVLGSVKPNVGHLEAASGVTGLIKTSLALRHRLLPPTLHFDEPNPRIDFANSPFYVSPHLTKWKTGPTPRRAGVSSFGVGGTNAHLVLEEAPERAERCEPGRPEHLLVLSARTPAALAQMSANLAAHLREYPDIPLADIAYTLQTGRRAFSERRTLVCRSADEALTALQGADPSRTPARTSLPNAPAIAFLFPGQGAQQLGMGRELYASEPLFRAEIDRGAQILKPLLGLDVRVFLCEAECPAVEGADEGTAAQNRSLRSDRKEGVKRSDAEAMLSQTRITQPVLFLLEVALARLWMSWGVRPQAMIGHSLGEYTAACLAGVFSLEEGLALLAERGRLMEALPEGAMSVVRLSEEDLAPLLPPALAIAAVNAPGLCTVSGTPAEIEALEGQMAARGIACHRLKTSHAFHSAMMDPILDAFAARVGQTALCPPQIPYLSNVTGRWITSEEATDPAYWVAHLREAVRFADGLNLLLQTPDQALLEVGPGKSLTALVRRHPAKIETHLLLLSLGDPKSASSEYTALTEALGRLWMAGIQIDWAAYHAPAQRRRVSLPTYPFERVRCWVEAVERMTNERTCSSAALPPSAMNRLKWPRTKSRKMRDKKGGQVHDTCTSVTTDEALVTSEAGSIERESFVSIENRKSKIEVSLLELLYEMTGISPQDIDPDASFLEMGLDSLFLTQAGQAVQNRFKVKVTFRHLLEDYPCPRALAGYLDTQIPPEAEQKKLLPEDTAGSGREGKANPGPSKGRGGRNLRSVRMARQGEEPRAEELLDAPLVGDAFSPLNTSSPYLHPGAEQVIQQQLAIMAQQLALLQGNSFEPRVSAGGRQSPPSPQHAPLLLPTPAPSALSAASPAPAAVQNTVAQHGPFRPIQKNLDTGLTTQQQAHLESLIARYVARTPRSKELTRQHRDHLADPRVVAGFRANWKEMVYPIVAARSAGSRLWDVDGNEFVDVTMGFGVNLFGHSPGFITRVLEQQLRLGVEIGPQSPLAGQAALLMCEMIGMERAAFCNTGSEAVMVAMRLARTVTGRDKIAFFTGDYHGTFDEVLVRAVSRQGQWHTAPIAPGIPQASVDNVLLLEYGTPESLKILKAHAHELAAVMVEPVQSRRPDLQPADFLREVRELTRQAGAALIFDEVITGFRCHPGGAQAHFGIQADLATYGKIVGGGMPIGVVAGRAEYMDALDGGTWHYGDSSFPEVGVTFFAGTFVRHPLALAAAVTVLEYLKAQGPALQEALNGRATDFARTLNAEFAAQNLPIHVPNFGSIFSLRFDAEWKWGSLLYFHLREKGLHLWEGRPFFLSTAHTDEDIAFMLRVFRESVAEMQTGGFLPRAGGKEFTAEVTQAPAGKAARLTSAAPDLQEDAASHSPQAPVVLPLTAPQTEVWLAAQRSDAASCAFNESITLHLRGPLDPAALQGAVQKVVERHEALRATFDVSGERQFIAPCLSLEIPLTDLSALEGSERQTRSDEILACEGRTPFDLERGPLLRAQIVRMAQEEHLLVLTAHHIACDGWSFGVILTELGALYSAALEGRAADIEPSARFSDYAARQAAEETNASEAYWLAQLQDQAPPLELPTDRPRTAGQEFPGGRERLMLDGELLLALRRLSAKRGCTLHTLLLGGFTALLQRLAGATDLIVGLPAAGQASEENSRLVGHCVHLLPLRVNAPRDLSFADHVTGLKRLVLDAYDHQGCTFSTLLRKLDLPREPGRTPLISVTFNVDRYPAGPAFAGLELKITTNPRHFFQFDLGFNLIESPDSLEMECDYRTDLFDSITIGRWLNCFRTLLADAVINADQPVSRLHLLAPTEQRLLEEWSGRAIAAPQERCVHEVFEAWAAERPEAIAIRFQNDTTEGALTYAELNVQADRWAGRLRALGVEPDAKVGLCLERSPQCIVAMLAILKAGGAYVPLDPSYPAGQLLARMELCGLRLILTQSRLATSLPAGPARLLCMDIAEAEVQEESGADRLTLPTDTSPRLTVDSLAYVLYTSGSTGQAQGVAIPHRGIVRLVCGADYVALNTETICLHHSPAGFDASTFEIWGPLLNGGTLALLPPAADTLTDLAQAIAHYHVDTLWLTAGLFHAFVDHQLQSLQPLRQLLAGGDVLSSAHVERCLKALPALRLINGYGPTENTTFTCCHTVQPEDMAGRSIPIGRPIQGTWVSVVDLDGALCPIGVPGELTTGGDGLAREYLNRPDLTAERFAVDPDKPERRYYRTGDRARWRNDGTLEFLGRLDGQVKLRGYRVEPGEIEQTLRSHASIREAAVTAERGETGERRLIAYYCLRPDRTLDPETLHGYLQSRLPGWLIPAAFMPIKEMPLTPNGKLDRRALAAASARELPAVALTVSPEKSVQGEREKEMARLWQRTLGVRQIGLSDDFFRLGGDSLLALRLMAEIERVFGTRLPLTSLFQAPTVSLLTRLLSGGAPDPLSGALRPAQVTESGRQENPRDTLEEQVLTLTPPMASGDPSVLLVPIRPAGSQPPLFCVHHVHGTVFCYQSLVRYLSPDLPIYGLQGHGVDDMERPEATLEEIAADCIAAARTVCPNGPFLVCGLSFGGVVALEMARQLQDQGLPVAFVGLLDTYAPAFFQNGLHSKDEARSVWTRIKEQAGTVWRLPASRRASYLQMLGQDGLRSIRKALRTSRGNETPWTDREEEITQLNLAALRAYTPRPCRLPVTLFRAVERSESRLWDPMLWWGELLGRDARIKEVFGNHFSLIREPFVRDVAAQMNAALTEVFREAHSERVHERPVRNARAA